MSDREQFIERLRNRARVLNYDERQALADLLEHDAAVLEGFRNAPRWTGGYIAANERDGEYIDTSELDAALQQAQRAGR